LIDPNAPQIGWREVDGTISLAGHLPPPGQFRPSGAGDGIGVVGGIFVLDFDPAVGTLTIMPAYVTREEFEARVGVLEREVEGEKLVTRYILEQTRRNSDDLAAIKGRLDRVEEKVDAIDRKVDALVRDLPTIVANTMREVLRERDQRS
jgi:hypothetical protein